MSSDIYTLPELVDLALKSPEAEKTVEAVNFNILRVILHKILLECKLQNVTGEWKASEAATKLGEILIEDKLLEHPTLISIAEEEKRSKTIKVKDKVKIEPKTSTISQEIGTQISDDLGKRDIIAGTDVLESPVDTDKPGKDDITMKDKIAKKSEILKDISGHTSSKGFIPEGSMFQLWEMKKLVKRLEAVEEELNSIVQTVDELQEWKKAKTKRFQLTEGEFLGGGYSGPTVGREEFEDTVDELGEALVMIRTKQKEQEENCATVSQDIKNELRLRPTEEETNLKSEELQTKLNTLSKAFRNMQKLIKDVIFPEACGTTKCLSCKRKAHLPLSGLTQDYKKGTYDDPVKSNIKNVGVTKSTKLSHDLRFTTACYKRLVGEDGKHTTIKGEITKALKPDEKDKHTKKQREDKEQPINVEAFEVAKLSSEFLPLRPFPDSMRRDCIHIPSNRPKKAPFTILFETN